MKIYFLSGLGADSRVFKRLLLPRSFEPIYIDWLLPENKEPLIHYAGRISAKIDNTEPFILVGLSFGGILASEMSAFVNPVKTIIISSVMCRRELPLSFKIASFFKLNKLIPEKANNKPNFLIYWLFGIDNKKDKALLKNIIVSSNTVFSQWAINEILNWKRKIRVAGIVRIHGDRDRLLPMSDFKPDHLVKEGSHFMIVNRAKEISAILTEEINAVAGRQ